MHLEPASHAQASATGAAHAGDMPGKRTAAGYEVVSTDGLGLGAEADEQEPLRQQLPAAAAARPSLWRRRPSSICSGAIVLLAVLALAARLLAEPGSTDDCLVAEDVVCTPDGDVRGVVGDRGRTFYRVPYALPPIQGRRWQPPSPSRPWRGVLDARTLGKGCVQSSAYTGGAVWGAEDCLYVNVYTPHSAAANNLLPTMVYFHGGSFSGGAPDGYDGAALAEFGDVVVVTVAFRLNVFGHLASPAIKARSTDGSAGSFGIADQRESLRWVQRNIASYFGDPSNVLIFGHSSPFRPTRSCYIFSPFAIRLWIEWICHDMPRTAAETRLPLPSVQVVQRLLPTISCRPPAGRSSTRPSSSQAHSQNGAHTRWK
jgi:hypothetical protein